MPASYRIDIKTTAGVKVAEISKPVTLAYSHGVNEVGVLDFTIARSDPAAAHIIDKYQVELWRRWPEEGIASYKLFDTILRDDAPFDTEEGLKLWNVRCYGALHLFTWWYNAYAAETTNRTKFTSAKPETIVKTLVQYNCTSSGTTGAGRDRDATVSGARNGYTITLEADSARGVAMDYQSTRASILDDLLAVQNICATTATTFDLALVKQSGATYQFQFKTPYLGSDLSSSVIFSEEFNNMRSPRLERIRSTEKTAIMVGGGGTGTERTVVGVAGPNLNFTTNDIEMFYNGASTTGGSTSGAILGALGEKEAEARTMRPKLSFDVLQKTFLFGRDYNLGDVVTSRFVSTESTQQVIRASGRWRPDGGEDIGIELRDTP